MKTPCLLAILAVAATASAAGLKDPTEVARNWNQTIEQARQPLAKSLRLQPSIEPPGVYADTGEGFRFPRTLLPRSPLYDAPSYRVPKTLPDNLPPGAKPWNYGGRTYWLVPLGPAGDK